MRDIAFGLAGGFAGAALWTGVFRLTGYETGWIAWGVGGLVGYTVALAILTAWRLGLVGKPAGDPESAYRRALLLAMVRVMVSDGSVDETEIASIRSVLSEVGDAEVDEEAIRREARRATNGGRDVIAFLGDLAPRLDAAQRESVVRSAILAGLANGLVSDAEQRTVGKIANALEVTDSHLHGILAGVVSS
jgi:uncharacterized tellurite resistance protein B-like protein